MTLKPTNPSTAIDNVRAVDGAVKQVAATVGGIAGPTSTALDPTCTRLAGLNKIPPLVRGFVVRSGIGSYDCEVQLSGGHTIPCTVLAPMVNPTYGVSQACIPVPGTDVLVFVPSAGLSGQQANYGIIIGALPDDMVHGAKSPDKLSVKKFADTEYTEGGVSQLTEGSHMQTAADTRFMGHGEYQYGRPHDIVPGEYALLNHAGAGLVIGALSTTIKGSEMASVRCSAIDDQVRIHSGHFKHINAAGSEEIFDDGGFISIESAVSLYQCERLGVKSEGTPAFTWETDVATGATEVNSGVSPLKPLQTAKKRMYRYAGYLGDVVNVFIANPDPSEDVATMDADSKDQGLLHYHVDSSGRFMMRSAGGIVLERFDRIPVPKRKHYAWDPGGDLSEATTPEEKKGFKLAEDHQASVGLLLGDMAAWWDNCAYARFRQFKNDFTIKQQAELECPADDYDEIGKASENFQEYDTRHSYVSLTPNGGIVLRDAWGSEIVMADGRITFNAAKNIEIRSGSSVVILGGDDVVAKAVNSIDLSTTNKDIRLKAENNMQLVSTKRGILIQSKSEGGSVEWDKVGEELESKGVVIKADKAHVAMLGKNTDIQGSTSVNIASFDEDGEPSGNINIAGKQVSVVADGNAVIAAKNGESGVIVSESSAIVCAPSAMLIGGRSAAEASGNKLLVGIPIDGFDSLYGQVTSICKNAAQTYLDSVAWLDPVSPKVFSKIEFKFRTTQQYDTHGGYGIVNNLFSVYEPSWAAMKEAGREILENIQLSEWVEKPDTVGEYPWPGKDKMASGYMTHKETFVTAKGVEQVGGDANGIDTAEFSQYHILQSES